MEANRQAKYFECLSDEMQEVFFHLLKCAPCLQKMSKARFQLADKGVSELKFLTNVYYYILKKKTRWNKNVPCNCMFFFLSI